MNRILSCMLLNNTIIQDKVLTDTPFISPHWQPDHLGIYVNGPIAMSATQRFVTPECQTGLMPYQDYESGCVINADVYLTHR